MGHGIYRISLGASSIRVRAGDGAGEWSILSPYVTGIAAVAMEVPVKVDFYLGKVFLEYDGIESKALEMGDQAWRQ